MNYRTEHDSLGEMQVEADKYWGAQTQRSLENFPIGHDRMPLEIIRAFALLKNAAARANRKLGKLDERRAALITAVCEEIAAGKWDAQFPLSVWQTWRGSRCSTPTTPSTCPKAPMTPSPRPCTSRRCAPWRIVCFRRRRR